MNIVHKMGVFTSVRLGARLLLKQTEEAERRRKPKQVEETQRERDRRTTRLCVTDCVCMRQYAMPV